MIEWIAGAALCVPQPKGAVNVLADRFALAPIAFKLAKAPGSARDAAQISSRFGRLMRFDTRTGNWMVDVDGDVSYASALLAIRGDSRVAVATPVVPTLDHEFPRRNQTDVLEAGLKIYETRYQEFLKVAPPRLDGRPWRQRAPHQEALGSQLWRLKKRAFPGKTIDMRYYRDGAKIADSLERAEIVPIGRSTDIVTGFTSIGPRNLTPPSRYAFGLGDVSGRVNDLAIHPTNDNVWYAATSGGGVWKTTDGGVNWVPLSDDWPGMNTSCVTIDPNNPNTVYVGGGDIPNLYVPVFRTAGLQKSTDGGTNWTQMGVATFGEEPIADILVHPENSNIVIACTARVYDTNGSAQAVGSIYRSVDGGANWSVVEGTDRSYFNLAISAGPAGSRRLYCSSSSGLLRSTDNGATWSLLAGVGGASQTEVEAGRSASGNVYYATSSGVMTRSTDYGDTWGTIASGLSSTPGYDTGQSWYNLALGIGRRTTIVPFSTDMIYVSHIEAHFSDTSSGTTWETISGPGYSNNGIMHVDQHAVEPFPTSGLRMLFGNDGGVYESVYDAQNGTHTITNRSADFVVNEIYAADYHPTNDGVVLTGAQDNGSQNSNGNLSDWRIVTGYDGGYPVIYDANTNIQLTSRQRLGLTSNPDGVKLFRTDNNWGSFVELVGPAPAANETTNFICPVVEDPNNPAYVYVGTNYLYRYRIDLNGFFGRLGNQNFGGALESICVAPTNSARLYVGTNNGRIWMSTDFGSSWTELNTASLPDRAVNSIAVHPASQTQILVGLGGTGAGPVYRCPDTSAVTWVNESGNVILGGVLPQVNANKVFFDPFDPDNVYYAGTDLGLYRSQQAGYNWQRFGDTSGLPNVEITDIDYVPGTNYLHIATFGRGLFRTRFPQPVFPSTMTITGSSFTGAVVNLERDDASNVRISPTLNGNQTILQIDSTCPVASPSELDLILRSTYTGSNMLVESIDLWNWVTGRWVNEYNRNFNGFGYDDEVVLNLTASMGSYLQSGTRALRARVRVGPVKAGVSEYYYRHFTDEFHFRMID